MNTQREGMESMARMPSKMERACDTTLVDLRGRLKANEEEHVTLTTTITTVEKMRRTAIRTAAAVRPAKKSLGQKPPDGLVGPIKEPPDDS